MFNKNPVYGLSVLVQASMANTLEKSRFGSNTRGTNGDAFRHAVWNALGSYYTSESFMESFATAHEKGSADYNSKSVDTIMDLHNNAIGRYLVKKISIPSNAPNEMYRVTAISNGIASAAANGKLVRYVVKNVEKDTVCATDSSTSN